jgi:hypothetical protein
MPTSVSRRFPVASKNTNVVLPTPWRLANASPSGVLRSARTNATRPRNSGRSASTTRLSWAQFGQPGKSTCTIAGCVPMTARSLYPGWRVSATTATMAAIPTGAAMNNIIRRCLRLCRRAIACCRAALRLWLTCSAPAVECPHHEDTSAVTPNRPGFPLPSYYTISRYPHDFIHPVSRSPRRTRWSTLTPTRSDTS